LYSSVESLQKLRKGLSKQHQKISLTPDISVRKLQEITKKPYRASVNN